MPLRPSLGEKRASSLYYPDIGWYWLPITECLLTASAQLTFISIRRVTARLLRHEPSMPSHKVPGEPIVSISSKAFRSTICALRARTAGPDR
jgi:hypothetical protein